MRLAVRGLERGGIPPYSTHYTVDATHEVRTELETSVGPSRGAGGQSMACTSSSNGRECYCTTSRAAGRILDVGARTDIACCSTVRPSSTIEATISLAQSSTASTKWWTRVFDKCWLQGAPPHLHDRDRPAAASESGLHKATRCLD